MKRTTDNTQTAHSRHPQPSLDIASNAEGRPVDMELVESVMKTISKMTPEEWDELRETAKAIEESGEWKHYL